MKPFPSRIEEARLAQRMKPSVLDASSLVARAKGLQRTLCPRNREKGMKMELTGLSDDRQ